MPFADLHDPDEFVAPLLKWHERENKRTLPWAGIRDPYKIWVSEIMLQQTQASTVVSYFERFMARLPTIADLAEASADTVMSLWAGLGYYSRARNLHKTAKLVQAEFGGKFPPNAAELIKLPGIGRSTAGAISALAFGLREPILDGNAKRVYARTFVVDGESASGRDRELWAIADKLTPAQQTAEYTQSIMDLGATICLPRNPNCKQCPLSGLCQAYASGVQEKYPIRTPAKAPEQKRIVMIVATSQDRNVLLERRSASGIWNGLWCFPLYDESLEELEKWFEQTYSVAIRQQRQQPEFEHRLTHIALTVSPLICTVIEIFENFSDCGNVRLVPIEEALRSGVPVPVRMILKSMQDETCALALEA